MRHETNMAIIIPVMASLCETFSDYVFICIDLDCETLTEEEQKHSDPSLTDSKEKSVWLHPNLL